MMTGTTMEALTRVLAQSPEWPTRSIIALLVTVLAYIITIAHRPPSRSRDDRSTPKPLASGYCPSFLSTWRFFNNRHGFYNEGVAASSTGNFSLAVGPHHLVGLSRSAGREAFFHRREMEMVEGFTVFFPTVDPSQIEPSTGWQGYQINAHIMRTMRTENIRRCLSSMLAFAANAVTAQSGTSTLVDPFDVADRLVFQFTMSAAGFDDVRASSPSLAGLGPALLRKIEGSTSAGRVLVPWLRTPGYRRRVAAIRELAGYLGDAVRGSGRKYLMATLFAAQINTPLMAVWLLVYLSGNANWMAQARAEIDAVLTRYRSSPQETPVHTLQRTPLETWESDFPVLDLCLRECIRMHLTATTYRRNCSDRDIPIGETGEVIPGGSYAFYILEEAHANPAVYSDPGTWDPARFSPGRAEDKGTPLAYLGWGAGRHACLGMRLAKLEVAVVVASFVAAFDLTLCDQIGRPMDRVPKANRYSKSAHPPAEEVRLRCCARS
ncbi:cytochrome P450 [Aspergillus campestris IBT 28561]|uniref:Cytochrome P450 n=1 Tax=Aspergillus campestris (strain IBT 28561) TaxID=1392248 RepID=A0A2I1CQE6_ASPC2|nr:cytochrome P450 [Aspergillus campestris IBT 28561]PKX99852.1 cytochrome P450 [Aspergillus campestris IBT 28561]